MYFYWYCRVVFREGHPCVLSCRIWWQPPVGVWGMISLLCSIVVRFPLFFVSQWYSETLEQIWHYTYRMTVHLNGSASLLHLIPGPAFETATSDLARDLLWVQSQWLACLLALELQKKINYRFGKQVITFLGKVCIPLWWIWTLTTEERGLYWFYFCLNLLRGAPKNQP